VDSTEKSFAQALALHREERHDDAIRACRKLLRKKPSHRHALGLLAHAALDAGRPIQAEEAADRLTRLQPDDAAGWNLKGRVRLLDGDPEAALTAQQQAVACAPEHPLAWHQLGLAQKILGDTDSAVSSFRQAHQLAPDAVVMRYNYALALIDTGRGTEAEQLCREALEDGQGPAEIEHALGMSLLAQERLHEAARLLESAVTRHPGHPGLRGELGSALGAIGNKYHGMAHLRESLGQNPHNVVTRENLVKTLRDLGRIEEALVELDTLASNPGYQGNQALFRAALLGTLDRHDEALELAKPYLDDPKERLAATGVLARGARKTGHGDEAITRIKRLASEVPFDGADKKTREQLIGLDFALGILLDQNGDTDTAFAVISRANQRRRGPYDRERHRHRVDRLITTYTRDAFGTLPKASLQSDMPIFIVGLPRSGTSLLEQMLDSHPQVHGAGELASIRNLLRQLGFGFEAGYPDFITDLDPARLDELAVTHVDYLRELAGSKSLVTDKMPGNFIYLGFIAQLLPDARIIHCRRTPQATALSILFQDFTHTTGHAYANDLGDIGFEYRQYQRLMAHWEQVLPLPIHTVDYEQVISDPESTTRELCDFLDLDWDPAMLKFHESSRVVVTASNQQVREKLYSSAVDHWTRYRDHLVPFEDEINDLPNAG